MIYGIYMQSFGKSGHKAKIHADYWLVMASEFARLKTGRYCDGQMDELLNAIGNYSDPNGVPDERIRKRRLYIVRNYRLLYNDALESAKRACDGGSFIALG